VEKLFNPGYTAHRSILFHSNTAQTKRHLYVITTYSWRG